MTIFNNNNLKRLFYFVILMAVNIFLLDIIFCYLSVCLLCFNNFFGLILFWFNISHYWKQPIKFFKLIIFQTPTRNGRPNWRASWTSSRSSAPRMEVLKIRTGKTRSRTCSRPKIQENNCKKKLFMISTLW